MLTINGSFAKLTAPIAKWMRANSARFVDKTTGEINMTLMVDTWDLERASGSETLDSDHPAWDVALDVALEGHRVAA